MIGSWGPGRGRRAEASRPGARDVAGEAPARPVSARSASVDSQSRVVLGWAMAAVASMVLLFLVTPFGWQGSSPAIDPITSTGPGAPPESVAPQTWVLSSTVVKPPRAKTAAADSDAREDVPREDIERVGDATDVDDAVERPAPWIIRVPRAAPSGQAVRTTPTAGAATSDAVSALPRPSRPSTTSAAPSPAPSTTSVPAPPTSTPEESCPPSSPTETAPPPTADDGNVSESDPGEDPAVAGDVEAPSRPAADAGQGAVSPDPCGG